MTIGTLSQEVEDFWVKVSTEIKRMNMEPEKFNPTALENYYDEKSVWWKKDFINQLIDEARRNKKTRNLCNFLLYEYVNLVLYDLDEYFIEEKQTFLRALTKGINQTSWSLRKQTVQELISSHVSMSTHFEQYYKQRSKKLEEELGHSCLNKLYAEMNQADIERYTNVCVNILHLTKDLYWYLQKKTIKLESHILEAEWQDLLFIQKNDPFHQCFKDINTKTIFTALGHLNYQNIFIHESNIVSRPNSLAIDLPNEIYIFIQKGRGSEYLQSLLHEIGHGIYYSSLKKEYHIEQKQLGFRGITEAFAYSTQLLLLDKNFLASLNVIEDKHIEALIDYYKWDFLRQLRLVCVQFLLAVKHMEKNTYESLMNFTKKVIEETFFVHFPKELYWLYIGDLKTSLEYVAGWVWGIQLRHYMKGCKLEQQKQELFTLRKDSDLPLVLNREEFNFLKNDAYQIGVRELFTY
ncbi:hypothetical protein ABES25_12725 [Bacillus gobiensis]|uniref:hypothetical protein n=1 Tax=Bacillus gobiensis TaxID=1441095 RepID=UPI003D1B08D0